MPGLAPMCSTYSCKNCKSESHRPAQHSLRHTIGCSTRIHAWLCANLRNFSFRRPSGSDVLDASNDRRANEQMNKRRDRHERFHAPKCLPRRPYIKTWFDVTRLLRDTSYRNSNKQWALLRCFGIQSPCVCQPLPQWLSSCMLNRFTSPLPRLIHAHSANTSDIWSFLRCTKDKSDMFKFTIQSVCRANRA